MSIFIGSNAGETIEPGFVSPTVAVLGHVKSPSAAFDLIIAGSGNDIVAGGGGNDIAFLGAGDDLFIWNSGDGSDFVDGGSGTDTLAFNGSAAAETIKISTGPLGTLRVSDNVERATETLVNMEHMVISAGAGDDIVDASALPAGHVTLEIFGGLGNDTLIGSSGNDFFNGGDGNDTALMGAGDDTFVWNPGDDNDIVDGQAGTDTLIFNGANIAEQINIQANGTRTLLTRDIANITMDLNSVEHIQFNALGGADIVTVHDLSGTGVTEVDVNLAAAGGGGDGAADQVIVQGTAGNDTIHAETNGTWASVTGLAAVTNVTNLEAIDQLIVDGGAGNDTLIGGAGSQILHGGEGDDVLAGGAGDDQMFGDAGNDRMVWNPGDGTDLMEGGDGLDTAEVNGGNGAEVFTVTANGTRVRFDRISPAPFSLDIGTTEKLVVNMGGGDDILSATGNLASLIGITVDGGAGNDTILGSNGNDLLFGGEGNDFIDGNQGADSAFLGAGDDTFQWDPGDGSDLVDGQGGTDTLLFNGANIAEQMDVLPNGSRALFTRNIGNITMDLNGIERINVNALGGADLITVHDMTGTDVKEINVNLAGTLGGATGDGAADQVVVQGTSDNDVIHAETIGTSGTVTGLAAVTNVTNLETIDQLVVDGGAGNDTLIGGAGSQVLHGGDGDDVLQGGAGDDQMFGDAGNDRMVWNPGDGTDLMEGGDGIDTAEVNGGNGAEQFTATANGTRVRFDRISPAPFSLDIGTTETLVVNMNGGDDTFSATGNLSPLISVIVDGGAGNDTILGGNGNDLLFGGDGNDFIDGNQGADTAFLGTGDDTFQWDPGDGSDVVDGQDGFDTLLFNGANIAEQMDVLANGTRSLFTRNIGNITMDLNSMERININALGGADLITVHDMTGTGVSEVNVNLAGTLGGPTGDGAADQVIVQGTSGDDVIHAETSGSSATVTGLAAVTNVTNLETIDQLVIDGGAGNDTIFGSAGNDFVVGGKGADTAFLGAGDDTFVWNPGDGNDVVEGQDGFDTLAFNGANVAEKVDVLANGSRTLFTRDIANINMDVNGVERIDFNGLGGADNVTVHDLSGTGVAQVNVKLAGTLDGSAGDGAADQVTVEATSGDDVAVISGDANGVSVAGLAAQVNLTGVDGTLDHLQVNGGDGDDVLDASHLAAGAIGLVLDGGAGNDVILGSAGDDVLRGGPGDDIINGGGGNDIIDAGPGDNVVIQGFTSGEDRIDLRGIADVHDFASVLAHARDVDGSAVIDFGEGTEMKVADVNVASLHASDFLLA